MANRKPEVPAEVADVINATSQELHAALERRDFATANETAKVRWNAIPEPKSQWAYYPDVLPRSTADLFVRAGAVEAASEWLTIAMGSAPAGIGENVPLDRVAARVKAATGDHEGAELIAGTLLEMYGKRPFTGDDSDLLPYAKAYQARTTGDPDEDSDDEPDNPVPSSEGGAATERPDLDDEIERLSEAGSLAMDSDDWRAAVEHWTEALEIIPAPRSEWTASTWLYTVLGDAYYTGGRIDDATAALGYALKCPDAFGNAFLWLRIGQVLIDDGNTGSGIQSLMSAYMLEGREIFEDQDPKYLTLLSEHADLDDEDDRT